MNIFQKAKAIITEPVKFFEKHQEKGVLDAFLYLVVLGLITVILGSIVSKVYLTLMSNMLGGIFAEIPFGFPFILAMVLFGYVLLLGMSFVGAGILHLYIKILGGKLPYHKTYQLVIYSQTPRLLIGWIPFVSMIAGIWDIILLIIGTHKMYKFSTTKSVLMYIIPYFAIIFLVFAFVAGTILFSIGQ